MSRSAKSKGKIDREFLAFVRTQGCCVATPYCVSLVTNYIESHHSGPRGLSQKADDRTAIPLCAYHHRIGPESAHTLGKHFFRHHRLNRDTYIAELNAKYEQQVVA